MGDFKGHAFSGSLFLLFGFWWSVKFPLKYLYRRNKHASSFGSKAGFQRLEFAEGIFKVVFTLVGMTAEQFVSNGPHLKLYDYENKQFYKLMYWQHATMYLFFCISGSVDVVMYTTNILPVASDKMMLSLAVFAEGILFHYHIHGRDMLDFHLHQLLVVTIFGGAFCILLEIFFRGIVILEMLRTSLCILQGTWFWQIAFVLYPPSGREEWDQMAHDNMMFLIVCYCWHYVFAILITVANYAIINWIVRSKVKQAPTMEIGLLKTSEQDQESEEEM